MTAPTQVTAAELEEKCFRTGAPIEPDYAEGRMYLHHDGRTWVAPLVAAAEAVAR